MTSDGTLARRLGTGDAVVLGVGSMVGAGVFAAFGPAARAAGDGLLLALALAGLVALCGATASAQLAAQYPSAGGTYLYGRERLGPWPGFLAGWGFVVGKTASCAAMALTVATYAVPAGAERPTAAVVVALLTVLSCRGVTRTVTATRVLVALALTALAVLVVAAVAGGARAPGGLPGPDALLDGGVRGTLQAAGLLFFAFAGFARLATLGEEVRDPARTIPRAVLLALGLVLAVYLAVALALLLVLGADGTAASDAPLADAAEAGTWSGATPLVRVGAVAASLGALLALLAGVGRTTLAMARTGDLPRGLAAVHPVHRVPARAQAAVGAVVVALVLLGDLRGVIGFSSFGVLLYYLVANLAALTQTAPHRRYPRGLQVVGAALCAVLVVTLPATSVAVGVGVLLVGVAYRVLRLRAA